MVHLGRARFLCYPALGTGQAAAATHEEALICVETNRLYGCGLGWTDVHLLASALLSSARLWTLDSALAREALRCGLAFTCVDVWTTRQLQSAWRGGARPRLGAELGAHVTTASPKSGRIAA